MVESTSSATEPNVRKHRICPWWMGYLLASPIRRLGEKPETILAGLIETDMTVLDIGCAMGFFSLPLARMVGAGGRVVCIDVQRKMLSSLERRAGRKGLSDRIETRLATQDSLGINDLGNRTDFALLMHVVHEVENSARFLGECHAALRPRARILIAEPRGHISDEEFEITRRHTIDAGFNECKAPEIKKSHVLLCEKI
ncbi:MAG: methyltransferase domain-containing protein [Thermoanaerobaculales bacterium]|nr:methyltransferase domain-containing protein [Thermoanaerobaculales bacterium]